jgi:hypothetical protein
MKPITEPDGWGDEDDQPVSEPDGWPEDDEDDTDACGHGDDPDPTCEGCYG